jgi:cytochrome c
MRVLAALVALLSLAGAVLAGSPANAPANAMGDPVRGRQIFAPCRTCHYPEKGYGHHNGPSLFAIFGRRAGTQEGFLYYSEVVKRSNLLWTPALLDVWLANPGSFLPGTNMMFVGIPDARDRADLIAYLAQFRDR